MWPFRVPEKRSIVENRIKNIGRTYISDNCSFV